MKKIISLTLALTAVFMSFSAVSAAEAKKVENKASYSDVKTTDACFDAVELLTRLDIMSGYESGEFKPNAKLTRAEFAKLIIEALGKAEVMIAEAAAGNDTIFSDVKHDHWAAGYITAAASSNIINGMGNGTFAPEANVTYAQAMKMLVCAAGYEQWSIDRGAWPEGYMYWGEKAKINDGIKEVSYDAEITRAQIAVMLKNTLCAPVCVETGVAYDLYGNQYPQLMAKDGYGEDFQTILTKMHHVYAVEGYMDTAKTFVITEARNFNDEQVDSEKKIDITTSYGSDSLNKNADAYIEIGENNEYSLIYMY